MKVIHELTKWVAICLLAIDMHTCAEGAGTSLIFLVSTLIRLSTETQHPELILLEESIRGRETFCPGETAQLKCIFPEGERALEWYVNGSERPINVNFLAEDLPGHNASTPFGNFTIVSILKEESFRGNYSCAVDIPNPGRDVRSNSVEVLFEGDYWLRVHKHLSLQNYNCYSCTICRHST